MLNSETRMAFISSYLAAYKNKIEILNKCGLFNDATLYEVFALKLCKLWFNKDFINLNISKPNAPYVDLISKDEKMLVQVGTTPKIKDKIESTIENIKANPSEINPNAEEIYFFMLDGSTLRKEINEIIQIGDRSINFSSSKNLITIKAILEKAKDIPEFQEELYSILTEDSTVKNLIERKFLGIVEQSKRTIRNSFEGLINNEYEIDRTDMINKIKTDNYHFLSIQGEAGSGKSALCQKLLDQEKLVLFTRADKFGSVNLLKEIWGLDINLVLDYIRDVKIYIYIDALEFIADVKESKLDILEELYNVVKKHPNTYLITTCRSCDSSRFMKLESLYDIRKYGIGALDDNEIEKLSWKYSIIKSLKSQKQYKQILESPFYVNFIVQELKSVSEISDIDEFRKLMWKRAICMEMSDLPPYIKTSDIRKAVETIVIERAKNFLPGIRESKINEELENVLLSNNIIVKFDDDKIRLKYDIFEDICFERLIDEKFEDSRGDFSKFFTQIEDFGRCIYRRYQIWVENKLFTKKNRGEFLYNILLDGSTPKDWRNQTIIGILRSNYCNEFFEEFEGYLTDEVVCEFLHIANLNAYEPSIQNLEYNRLTILKPCGNGRANIIRVLYERSMYKNSQIKKDVVIACAEYSRSEKLDKETAQAACKILEEYVEKIINLEKVKLFSYEEEINGYLLSLYRMVEYSKDWIKVFWKNIVNWYIENDIYKGDLSERIIKFTLKYTNLELAKGLPKELVELADAYWITEQKDEKLSAGAGILPYLRIINKDEKRKDGLSSKVNHYQYDFASPHDNKFFLMLLRSNFPVALDWLIKIGNKYSEDIHKSQGNNIKNIEIYDTTKNTTSIFWGNENFWMAGSSENIVPELIADCVFLLKEYLESVIENFVRMNLLKVVEQFVYTVKNTILSKSNNILLFSVISDIGFIFKVQLPGYALELATSIDLILYDMRKHIILSNSSANKLLEKQMLMISGLPELKKRYNPRIEIKENLQDYVFFMQLSKDRNVLSHAEKVLDYLYSKYPDNEKSAFYNLQIQKMDNKNLSGELHDNGISIFTHNISGEAKKITESEENKKIVQIREHIKELYKKIDAMLAQELIDEDGFLGIVRELLNMENTPIYRFSVENDITSVICCVIYKYDLTIENRSKLTDIILDVLELRYKNQSFCIETKYLLYLFKQTELDLDKDTMIKLKKIILKYFLGDGTNGFISNVSRILKAYLRTNKKLAKSIFYTVIGLAKSDMDRYIYDASILAKEEPDYKYSPNMVAPPTYIERGFRDKDIKPYEDRREQIINKYLIYGTSINLDSFKIDQFAIGKLCYISDCGLGLDDNEFAQVMKELYPSVIYIMNNTEDYSDFMDVYAVQEVQHFLRKELFANEDLESVINIMFKNIAFNEFGHDSFKIYEDTSWDILIEYFDAYKDSKRRSKCIQIIKGLEKYILKINDLDARRRMTRMLFLSTANYVMYDLNKCETHFNLLDKKILTSLWSKYGKYHLDKLLLIIYHLHIGELLPEVLVPLNISLREAKSLDEYQYTRITNNLYYKNIINEIITTALVDFNGQIKEDVALVESYENLLGILTDDGMREAAVLLEEFRIY